MVDYSRLMRVCQLFNNQKINIFLLSIQPQQKPASHFTGCGFTGCGFVIYSVYDFRLRSYRTHSPLSSRSAS